MVYTLTLNPSLDYIVNVDDFQLGTVNRASSEMIYPGGKGINVSMVLRNLGLDSIALGFIAGFTGEEIRRRVEEYGCRQDFIVTTTGWSRINVKLKSSGESEINGNGPSIELEAIRRLQQQLDQLHDGDILVLAGSLARSMKSGFYQDIMASLEGRGVHVVVDATKETLANTFAYRPFLIKPNKHELEELLDVTIHNIDEIEKYAKQLQSFGARNVLVSMAGDGAMLVAENGRTYYTEAPQGELVNSVGAGDSMVAGFIAGFQESGDYEHAFYMGVATGSASAFSEGMASKQHVEEIYRMLKHK